MYYIYFILEQAVYIGNTVIKKFTQCYAIFIRLFMVRFKKLSVSEST